MTSMTADPMAGVVATMRWFTALGRAMHDLPIDDPVVLFVFETAAEGTGGEFPKPAGTEVFPLPLPADEFLRQEGLPSELRYFVTEAPSCSGLVRCVVKSGTDWTWMSLPLEPDLLWELTAAHEPPRE